MFFAFSDDCIRIGSSKFSFILREYLQSAVVLISSPEVSDFRKNNFFGLNLPQTDKKKYDKSAYLQISAVFGAR